MRITVSHTINGLADLDVSVYRSSTRGNSPVNRFPL